MIKSAKNSIYIQQLYIYKYWNEKINPFLDLLVNKSKSGVKIKIMLNYNPVYENTNDQINITKKYLQKNGIKIKFHYTNWSYFSNMHNKAMVVDNKSVLISSINWNYNSVNKNREAGIIIENENISKYYSSIFLEDWNLTAPNTKEYNKKTNETTESFDENTIYIVILFTLTFTLIARDWRKRQWH